jgi:shikimate dehydrogenase
VRQPDGMLMGYNTDAPAVLDTLRDDAHFEPRGQVVVVLGASGAARAVCWALLQAEVAQIVVVNRTLERAEALLADLVEGATNPDNPRLLATKLPELVALAPDDAALPEAVRAAALVVNATSLGWHGDESPLDAALLGPGALVFDTIYRPTALLHAAQARGARTLDGLGMLVRQGARAFALWTGRPAPLETMWQAAHEALKHR